MLKNPEHCSRWVDNEVSFLRKQESRTPLDCQNSLWTWFRFPLRRPLRRGMRKTRLSPCGRGRPTDRLAGCGGPQCPSCASRNPEKNNWIPAFAGMTYQGASLGERTSGPLLCGPKACSPARPPSPAGGEAKWFSSVRSKGSEILFSTENGSILPTCSGQSSFHQLWGHLTDCLIYRRVRRQLDERSARHFKLRQSRVFRYQAQKF